MPSSERAKRKARKNKYAGNNDSYKNNFKILKNLRRLLRKWILMSQARNPLFQKNQKAHQNLEDLWVAPKR